MVQGARPAPRGAGRALGIMTSAPHAQGLPKLGCGLWGGVSHSREGWERCTRSRDRAVTRRGGRRGLWCREEGGRGSGSGTRHGTPERV
jgi:hypothetical protein